MIADDEEYNTRVDEIVQKAQDEVREGKINTPEQFRKRCMEMGVILYWG